jgi:hypothetical protein
VFFFEKKNQKTFATWHTRPISNWATDAKEQEFFASLFQKKSSSTLLSAKCQESVTLRHDPAL